MATDTKETKAAPAAPAKAAAGAAPAKDAKAAADKTAGKKRRPQALKRHRQSEDNRKVNAANTHHLNTARRDFFAVCESGDKAKATAAFKSFCSLLDKTAKYGTITKNAAARRKARAAAHVAKVVAKPAAAPAPAAPAAQPAAPAKA